MSRTDAPRRRPVAALLSLAVGFGGLALLGPGGCGDDPEPTPATAPTQDGAPDVEALRKAAMDKLRKPRRERIGMYLRRMKVPLEDAKLDALADALEAFQVEREAWWKKPATRALDKAAYAKAYRTFVDGHITTVRTFVDGQVGDVVVQRFVFDGRIIEPPAEDG